VSSTRTAATLSPTPTDELAAQRASAEIVLQRFTGPQAWLMPLWMSSRSGEGLGGGVLATAQAFAEQRAHVGGADGGDGLDAVVGLRGA
jgi:hypothetical protein